LRGLPGFAAGRSDATARNVEGGRQLGQSTEIRRIAVNTGGGDAPGLNAVIRAVVLCAIRRNWEVVGISKGYGGLLEDGVLIPLDPASVRGITHLGGTILGTTNRGNPFEWPTAQPDGTVALTDRSDDLVKAFHAQRLDALIAIGGDGSLRIANALGRKGIPIVGVPKTIDNDQDVTQMTFGFHTAVQTATEALDKLHSTAESHERIMVVEVMGRHAGWIALHAGLSGTADVILIPEIPYDLDSICTKIDDRYGGGRRFAIVVVAEGAKPRGGSASFVDSSPGAEARYGGLAERIARELSARTGHESRSLVLGHLQRGGSHTAYDRLIALRFGAAAVRCVEAGQFGRMVALDPPDIRAVPIDDAIQQLKLVPLDSDTIITARALGVCLGD
jgi:6-phosphofructokinase 1